MNRGRITLQDIVDLTNRVFPFFLKNPSPVLHLFLRAPFPRGNWYIQFFKFGARIFRSEPLLRTRMLQSTMELMEKNLETMVLGEKEMAILRKWRDWVQSTLPEYTKYFDQLLERDARS